MEQEKIRIRSFTMTIKEENGRYVLTKGQLQFLTNQYRNMFSILNRLLEERQILEFRLAEHRLKKLGISETKNYPN